MFAIAWLILITILLCLPGKDIPSIGFLSAIYFDKWVHIGLFTVLVILWCWYFNFRSSQKDIRRSIFWKMALAGIAYGTAMEFVQLYFIPGRSFDLMDIAADAVGSLAGLFYSIKRYIKK